ncbi:MAG: hypothetical protein HKN12_02310 [Gemmatimonadetes bacterium]|nr:hypothetical protein [Gemmatimonadota bacterium]
MSERPTGRVARLETKRDGIRKELESVNAEIEELGKQLGRRGRARGGRRPNARRLNGVTVQDAIVELLRETGEPLHYRDIARILVEEERYRTRSKNFLSTVAISIMRDERIERVESGVYRLRR